MNSNCLSASALRDLITIACELAIPSAAESASGGGVVWPGLKLSGFGGVVSERST